MAENNFIELNVKTMCVWGGVTMKKKKASSGFAINCKLTERAKNNKTWGSDCGSIGKDTSGQSY